jgi:signal transduction histidine kinase
MRKTDFHGQAAGTRLTLKGLRRAWSSATLKTFFDEVTTLTPPEILIDPLPPSLVNEQSLFKGLQIRDAKKEEKFEIVFAGDLQLQEPDIAAALPSATWVMEVSCDSQTRTLQISVLPTRKTRQEFANAEGFQIKRKLSGNAGNASFQARIFQKQHAPWPSTIRGVKVYYEGFRVLPYGDPRDDWLDIDKDYRSRGASELPRLRRYSNWNLPTGNSQELLTLQGSSHFFGGVFLTRDHGGDLRMLVNREGFLPSKDFESITDLVRLAIDLQVRQNYAARNVATQARKVDRERQKRAAERADASETPSAFLISTLQNEALDSIQQARAALARGDVKAATQGLSSVESKVAAATELSGETASEATMYRVLASMGLEQAAFIHEVNALALLADGIAQGLQAVISSVKDQRLHRRLSAIVAQCRDLRERLRRNAIYLADMTGIEGRRRRSRLLLLDRISKIVDYHSKTAAARGVAIQLQVPEKLRTPAMFPAELSAIFTNLLTNAIKFSGEGGKINIFAELQDDELVVRFENTGDAVNLKSADRWFEPFRSTTSEVDETLGQGMGLGLTITRSMLDEYGGTISFVPPQKNFSTAIELRIPT